MSFLLGLSLCAALYLVSLYISPPHTSQARLPPVQVIVNSYRNLPTSRCVSSYLECPAVTDICGEYQSWLPTMLGLVLVLVEDIM